MNRRPDVTLSLVPYGGGAAAPAVFAGGGSSHVWLDWDATVGADPEARLSRLCRWVIDAEAAGARYGLRLPGNQIAPGNGPTHYHRCLSALALYPA